MTTFISGPAGWADNDPVMQVRVADVIHRDQLTIQIAAIWTGPPRQPSTTTYTP
jgi:hypothetical protein